MKRKKNKKYIPCSGLAFSDKEDMRILQAYAEQGWIFRDFRFGCYVLHKEEAKLLQFSYDLTRVKKEEEEEYLQMFKAAGWTLIIQKDDLHFFCAPIGTAPIHSDPQSEAEEYRSTHHIAIGGVVLGLCLLAAAFLSPPAFIRSLLLCAGAMLAAGSGMLLLGTLWRIRKKRLRIPMPSFRMCLGMLAAGVLLVLTLKYLLSPYRASLGILYALLYMLCSAVIGLSLILAPLQYPLYRDRMEKYMKLDRKLREKQ